MGLLMTREKGTLMSPADVCKTPAGPVVVTVPYPNIAQCAMASKASTKVLVNNMGAHTLKTKIPSSNGDEAGSLMGVKSNKIMGEAKYVSGSAKVFVENSPAAIMPNSPTTQNNGNAVGMAVSPSQAKVMIDY